jgi:hypothetical protein
MPAPEPKRDVSPERKAAYYFGAAFQVVGLLLFLSVFVSGAMELGDRASFDGSGVSVRSMAFRAIAGMALAFVGGMIRKVGARGLAGSGVVLDPQRARGDLEPYSRMAGGMAKDALEEAGVAPAARAAEVVKIRCRACGELNEEDSKFCQECGKPV